VSTANQLPFHSFNTGYKTTTQQFLTVAPMIPNKLQ